VTNRLLGLGSALVTAIAMAGWGFPAAMAASDPVRPASTAPPTTATTSTGTPVTIPISPAGSLGNYNLSSSSYAIAWRFVLAEDTTIDRWYFAVNGEGADCAGGRDGYGSGDGGIHLGRITAVDPNTGFPTATLAAEQVNACEAYERAKREFALPDRHQAQYVQFAPTALKAGTMYAFVLTNVDPDPGDGGGDSGNHMSPNLNFADVDDMGPHARNTLDAAAPGAAYGVDPRETVMWSDDNASTWQFGDDVGWYAPDDGNGAMWPGGYRVAGGTNVPHGWKYMNWPEERTVSVQYTAAVDGVLVQAGGASSEDDVGVVTVRNLDTGESATTADLGTGLVGSALSQAVKVDAGQVYEVSTDGDVDTGSASPWDQIFDASASGPTQDVSSCPDCRHAADRPMLYALRSVSSGETSENPAQRSPPTTTVVIVAITAVVAAVVALLGRRRGWWRQQH
jgi:hypothetical protein